MLANFFGGNVVGYGDFCVSEPEAASPQVMV
jgi:hypothetical protein